MPLYQDAPPIRQGTSEVTLLTSAAQLPPQVRDYEQWRSGLAHRSTQDTTAEARAVCGTGEWSVRNPDAEQPEFEPVDIGVIHGCEGFVDEARYELEAGQILDDKLPWLLARELWTGTISGNPSLQSVGTDIGGSGPVANACDYLIANFEDASKGGKAFLHVPAVAMGQLVDANYVTRSGNRLLTISGHVVVPGPGYPGSPGSWGPTAAAAAATGECWIYVTGPVEVAEGPTTTINVGKGVAARRNLVEFYARKPVIYRFDTEFVYAALATLPALS